MALLEQRLYTMESNINRIEQQLISDRRSTVPEVRSSPQASLVTNQIELLKLRLNELECAVSRLDERTLSAAAKQVRGSGPLRDACRRDADQPVRLSTRN
jgi:hypothetical protein